MGFIGAAGIVDDDRCAFGCESLAIARPIPRDEPVTIAALPLRDAI
jgi:hypothetical protein